MSCPPRPTRSPYVSTVAVHPETITDLATVYAQLIEPMLPGSFEVERIYDLDDGLDRRPVVALPYRGIELEQLRAALGLPPKG